MSGVCLELERRGFTTEGQSGDKALLTFTNSNVREIIYLEQSALERQTVHNDIAVVMRANRYPASIETYDMLEYHLTKAGDTAGALVCKKDRLGLFVAHCFRCVPSIHIAGSGARQALLAKQLELESVVRASGNMSHTQESAKRLDEEFALIDTTMTLLSGYVADAVRKAARLVSNGDDRLTFVLVHYFFEYARQSGHSRVSQILASVCRDLEGDSPRVRVFLTWLEGRMLFLDEEYEACEVCLGRALGFAEQSGLVRSGILYAIAACHERRLRHTAALKTYAHALEGIDSAASCVGLYTLYLGCSRAFALVGDNTSARDSAHIAASSAIRASDDTGAVASLSRLALLCPGDSHEAREFLAKAAELSQSAESYYEQGLVLCATAHVRRCPVNCRKAIMLLSMVKDTSYELSQLRDLL